MRMTQYTVDKDGFCGLFSPIAENRNAAIIMLEDGPPDSYLVKTALKWLNKHLRTSSDPDLLHSLA
jgi:hypothetical protein